MDKGVRTVLIAGMYGAGAGTVLGLAAYPITNNVRSLFMGSSIGLYLGLALGIYLVANPDDPVDVPAHGSIGAPNRQVEPTAAYLSAAPRASLAAVPDVATSGRTRPWVSWSFRF
jgi:hypothetical protein